MAEQNRRREKNRDNQCIYQENERMGEQKDKRTDHGTPRKPVGNQRHQKRQDKNLNDGIAERFDLQKSVNRVCSLVQTAGKRFPKRAHDNHSLTAANAPSTIFAAPRGVLS
jgi:hypothetical protein